MDSYPAEATRHVMTFESPSGEARAHIDGRYQRLASIDRAHAVSLARSCHLSSAANKVSRTLAIRSVFQEILTSLPLIAGDFVTMWFLLVVTTAAVERVFGLSTFMVTRNTAVVASILLTPIARLKGLYPAIGISPAIEFREVVQSVATALCIFAGIGMVVSPGYWQYLIVSSLITFVLAIPTFPAVRYVIRDIASRYSWWGANAMIYAKADEAVELYQRLQANRLRGLRPAAILLSGGEYWKAGDDIQKLGIPLFDVRQALDVALQLRATWLLVGSGVSLDGAASRGEPDFQAEVSAIPHRVMLTTSGTDCGIWDRTQTIGSVTGLWLSNTRHSYSQSVLKRALDIVVAGTATLLFGPIILGIALAIRLSSPGPIFYSQKRIGRDGKIFKAWKFRSMVPDADRVLQRVLDSDPVLRREWDETHKLKRDPRVTSIGRIIRATSLDELPQLWNILRGDMGVVGPRPIIDSASYDGTYIRDYPKEFGAYSSVRPGLTGLWQVTCRNSGVYELRIYWDMYYIRNCSLWLDLYILLRTVRTVLFREGGY